MEHEASNMFVTFLPLLLMSLLMAIPANLIAREKGRNVALWTVLALVPLVNFACFWYFIGASNLKLERKMDELILAVTQSNQKSV